MASTHFDERAYDISNHLFQEGCPRYREANPPWGSIRDGDVGQRMVSSPDHRLLQMI